MQDIKSMGGYQKYSSILSKLKIRKLPLIDKKQTDIIHCIDISYDSKTVCYGKKQIHRLVQKGVDYVKLKDLPQAVAINDVKILRSGEILVLEQDSYDLVKYTT